MYNRYIGNTGKFYRVEDAPVIADRAELHHERQAEKEARPTPQDRREIVKKPSLFGGGLRFLDGLLPFGLETGDLILLVLFLFLFIESGDEEFLIILGFLAYSFFKER